jgi:hypothetical protein
VFEKHEQEISQIIEENLEAILSGKRSMEEVLQRHPQHAAGLRRAFEAATWLHAGRGDVAPRPGFISASRMRVVSRVKQEARSQDGKRAVLSFFWPQRRVFQWAAALVILVLIFSGAGELFSVAQNTIPGDQLYSVKRAGEAVSFGLTMDPIKKVELSIQYIDQRFAEVESLVDTGKVDYLRPALTDYNTGVQQSLSLLQQVGQTKTGEKKILAQQLAANLEEKADRLASLTTELPADVQAEMVSARELTLNSATSTLLILDEPNGQSGTPIPAGTVVPTQAPTHVPSKTPVPTLVQNEGKPEPTNTPPGNVRKPTITPRPTNENRPTKQPTQAEKPPKNDKPTRSDKKNN